MAEETKITEKEEPQAQGTEEKEAEKASEASEKETEGKETKASKRSFGAILKDEKQASEKKEESNEESEKEPSKETDDEKAKDKKPKVSANERIQGLIKEREERDTRIAELEEAVKTNEAKVTAAEKGKETPKATKEETIDYKELREELEEMEWTEKQIDVYIKTLQTQEKLKAEIEDLKADKDNRNREEYAKAEKEFVAKTAENYKKVSENYPELFGEADEESGLPQMKSEFEEEALKISELFYVPYAEDDGKVLYFNPLLTSKEGLDMLFSYITRKHRVTKEVKKEIETKEKLRKKVVETPESRTITKTKKRSFSDYLKAEKEAQK